MLNYVAYIVPTFVDTFLLVDDLSHKKDQGRVKSDRILMIKTVHSLFQP